MWASLIPGFRSVRAALAGGALWVACLWLWSFAYLDAHIGAVGSDPALGSLLDQLGPVGRSGAAAFGAFLVGSVWVEVVEFIARRRIHVSRVARLEGQIDRRRKTDEVKRIRLDVAERDSQDESLADHQRKDARQHAKNADSKRLKIAKKYDRWYSQMVDKLHKAREQQTDEQVTARTAFARSIGDEARLYGHGMSLMQRKYNNLNDPGLGRDPHLDQLYYSREFAERARQEALMLRSELLTSSPPAFDLQDRLRNEGLLSLSIALPGALLAATICLRAELPALPTICLLGICLATGLVMLIQGRSRWLRSNDVVYLAASQGVIVPSILQYVRKLQAEGGSPADFEPGNT